MSYATQRDRTPPQLELRGADWPAAPLNFFMTSGYKPGVWDLRWDDPSQLVHNSRFAIVGVNVYRAFDSEYGPYHRVTQVPLGATFWRDSTLNELVVDEDVTDKFTLFGVPSVGQSGHRYVFQTLAPIVKSASQNVFADSPYEVFVYVDGRRAQVLRIFGRTGEVEIDPKHYPDVATQRLIAPVVPTEKSKVTCTYRRNRAFIRTDLDQRTFYRLTTVAAPVDPECPCNYGPVIETPLEYASFSSSMEIEKLDWIWREAVRRNRWILDQGGERVHVFLKKCVGPICPCTPPTDHHRQPVSDCRICFGVGVIGGFEGPFAILIAPDDAEKKISQREMGRTVEHVYEVWTGPSPLLAQRDFIAKVNGERMSIGPVRMPSNRGMVLQQHFNIASMDEKDIRTQVPMEDIYGKSMMVLHKIGPERPDSEEITEKPNIPDERELRGHTATWENIVY